MRSAARSMRRGARLAVFASRVTCRLRRVADERLTDVQRNIGGSEVRRRREGCRGRLRLP